jgi:hypothetical protein
MNLFLENDTCTFTLILLMLSWAAANFYRCNQYFLNMGSSKMLNTDSNFFKFADQLFATCAGCNKQAVKAGAMDLIAKMMGTSRPAATATAAPWSKAAAATTASSPSRATAATTASPRRAAAAAEAPPASPGRAAAGGGPAALPGRAAPATTTSPK